MATEEHWTATRETNNFDELLEKVIMIRRPIFSDGYGKSAIKISLDGRE